MKLDLFSRRLCIVSLSLMLPSLLYLELVCPVKAVLECRYHEQSSWLRIVVHIEVVNEGLQIKICFSVDVSSGGRMCE